MISKVFRRFMIAVQFLTTVPIPGNYVREESDLGRSMIFYPMVGLLIGFLTWGLYSLGSYVVMPVTALSIALVGNIVLTGGLHLDGFGDMCDGFYAGKDKEDILRIMKDSHIGTMAVLGLFSLLILKFSLLFALLQEDVLAPALLLTASVGRWSMSVAAGLFPYARAEGGTAKSFVENVRKRDVVFSSLFMLIISLAVLGPVGVLISMVSVATALLFMLWVKKKIGGITGDVLGGLNEISEVCSLAALSAFL